MTRRTQDPAGPESVRVGVDTGGTFTDFIAGGPGPARAFKLPSTPRDPARAVLSGLAEIGACSEVVHGTTVATNAVLEGRGARVAFVATRGFRDLLALGRQARPSLYDLEQQAPAPPASSRLCFELPERLAADGSVLLPLDEEALARLAGRLAESGAEAIAVCFLFSFLDGRHERRAGEVLAATGLPVSLSCDVLPQHREYERAVATSLNAALVPVMRDYLSRLEEGLPGARLRIMQSSGGSIRPGHAARYPIHTVLSGPAGGVVGGAWAAEAAGFDNLITFDMGGTSTDVAAYEGSFRVTSESTIGGWPLPVPVLEIHTVGAGGGSIARRDPGGALKVGPQSAGAEPGPACYGRGSRPTVTDAHLVLGWIDPSRMAGGRVEARRDLAEAAVGRLARATGMGPVELAEGIVRLAETNMTGAIWRITCERGRDPRGFALAAFGGAGPLHACSLAERLELPRVVVPPVPGAFSAFGMLRADVVIHSTRGLLRRGAPATGRQIGEAVGDLMRHNRAELGVEPRGRSRGKGPAPLDTVELYLRYSGQSYEVAVPFESLTRATEAFHTAHQQLYGHSDPGRPVEVVAVGVRTVQLTRKSDDPALSAGKGDLDDATLATGRLWWRGWHDARFVERARLGAGDRVPGPAVIVEDTATTLVPPGWSSETHPSGCLILTRRDPGL